MLVVSPKGTVNSVIRVGSQSAIKNALDQGKAASLAGYEGASYVVPLNPSTAGAVSASVTKTGTGAATLVPTIAPHTLVEIKIDTAGALGTMKIRWRVGGSGAFSEPILSTAVSFVFRVPGTFCTLTFAAGAYVLNSTYTVGLNGTVVVGGGGIATVTQASSPIDDCDFAITVKKGGLPGVAVLSVSPDGGVSTLPDLLVPSTGVVIVPGTGIVLTASGTFVIDEVYSFLAIAPTYSTSDLTNALTALFADETAKFSLIDIPGIPATAAGAISAAAAVESALQTAYSSQGIDVQAFVNCPFLGDTVLSGGAPIVDVADDSAALRTAREGQSLLRTALFYGSSRLTDSSTSWKLKRGRSVAVAKRYTEHDPNVDVSDRELGPLDVYAMGVDAQDYQELDDAQFNGYQSERNLGEGAFVAVTSGGYSVKNLNTDADWQDAMGVRALNCCLRALRPVLDRLRGKRPKANADGTIDETVAKGWDSMVNNAIRRGGGLGKGALFTQPQVSDAGANILRTSQVGDSPHQVDVEYFVEKLGFVAGVSATGTYSGIITV